MRAIQMMLSGLLVVGIFIPCHAQTDVGGSNSEPGLLGSTTQRAHRKNFPASFSREIVDLLKLLDGKVDLNVIRTYVKYHPIQKIPTAAEIAWLKAYGLPKDMLLAMAQRGAETKTQITPHAGSAKDETHRNAFPNSFSPEVVDLLKLLDGKVDLNVIRTYLTYHPIQNVPTASEIAALKIHGLPQDMVSAMTRRGAETQTPVAQLVRPNAKNTGVVAVSGHVIADPKKQSDWASKSRLEKALDLIAYEYRRVHGSEARESVGFQTAPDATTYLIVNRNDLPVLAQPSLGTDRLVLLGLAQSGEYLPVLEERGIAFLDNPLSSRPSDNGYWCLVKTRNGDSGWIFARPSDSPPLAQKVSRPVAPANPGPFPPIDLLTSIFGAFLGLAMLAFALVWILGGSSRSSPGGGYYRTHGTEHASKVGRGRSSSRRYNKVVQWGAKRAGDFYRKTGWFSEEPVGSADKDGRVFEKTGMFTKEEVGRRDNEGRIFEKTGWFSEKEVGRQDKEGRVFEKTGWFSEKEVGRVDKEGRVFKKTGWFSEEEVGRIKKDT